IMARSARPVLARVWVSPVEMDRTEISTATTPAMPTTMTNEDAARAGRLRKFIAVTATTCLKVLIEIPLAACECVDDLQAPGAPGRRQPARQRQQNRDAGAPPINRSGHTQALEASAWNASHDRGKSRRRCKEPQARRRQTQQQCLDEYQRQHGRVGI